MQGNDFFFFTTHAPAYTDTYVSCTLVFVERFTAEELPQHLKKLIEEGFQEWEESLCKVAGSIVTKN